MCPSNTAKITAVKKLPEKFKDNAIPTTNVAFSISPSNVKTAAYLLPVRKTLVAPGFFEPIALGSVILKILLASMPKDIEPIK
jgi:hypothetical protein